MRDGLDTFMQANSTTTFTNSRGKGFRGLVLLVSTIYENRANSKRKSLLGLPILLEAWLL